MPVLPLTPPPRLLDLFCCQGGASYGYHLAGFDVVGVDHEPQPRYPFEFHQADALEFLADHGHEFDVITASSPCHDHSALRHRTGRNGTGWLLSATRTALLATGKPYALENVPGANMAPLVVLCGSMFGLGVGNRILRRHRWFETSVYTLTPPDTCAGRPVGGVYGHGGGGQQTKGFQFAIDPARRAMGIDWMSMRGLSQAVPPAYTEFLGAALLDQVNSDAAATARPAA